MFFMELTDCYSLEVPLAILKTVVNLIQWGIPIVLILFGIIDLGKAVMAGKEDEMKKAQGTLIKRFVYAVLIFLIVFLVQAIMGVVVEAGAASEESNWYNCWKEAGGNTSGEVEDSN